MTLYDITSEVYLGPSRVLTGGEDLADAILLWALVSHSFLNA